MNKIFSNTAWNDILSWQDQDKKTLKKIIQLIMLLTGGISIFICIFNL